MTPKRALFILTSHDRLGPREATGARPTGFHLGETATPWRRLRAEGIEVDFASVRGGRPPMTGHDPDDPDQRAFLADPEGGGRLERTPKAEEADPAAYAAVYFVGGHGTMWDFRAHPALHTLGRAVHEAGGVVAAICHGPAALADLTLSDGTHLVAGRELTAFPHAAEVARDLAGVVPFPLQTTLEQRGAHFTSAPDRTPHAVRSGRLLTAQNPQSAALLAAHLADLLRP
ncbi:type 1 glutamine amidotransferase domain-containing protein [Streptomyces sp. NPDC093085]|uniref:type 1 glutamine amidotransferase domain-containing protein n=1 Tax=Streptomyces sp. NPDC093085 TaxID=3155068 RepID=UPI00343E1EF9